MKDCGDNSVYIQLYLDSELTGPELQGFLAHLDECTACRDELQRERELSRLLRSSRPLYSASDMLRTRMATLSAQPRRGESSALAGFARDLAVLSRSITRPRYLEAAAAVVVLAALASLLLAQLLQRSTAASYVEAAVAAHRGFVDGSLPLEVRTGSPSAVTAWFAGKVPFPFRLPDSVGAVGQRPIYTLIGGRLVNYRAGYAALVAYQAKQDKISLLVTSSRYAVAAGGEQVRSGGLIFHYSKKANFNVISWSNHDLTYALVSSLPGSGKQSCLVCHQSMNDVGSFSANRWSQAR